MNGERSDRVVHRFALVTLALPGAVTTVALMVQLAELSQTPPRAPVYRGGLWAPSGWGPVWLLVLTGVLGSGLPAVFGLSSLPSLCRGDRNPAQRMVGRQLGPRAVRRRQVEQHRGARHLAG